MEAVESHDIARPNVANYLKPLSIIALDRKQGTTAGLGKTSHKSGERATKAVKTLSPSSFSQQAASITCGKSASAHSQQLQVYTL